MLLQSTGRGAATEHTAASGAATEHTKDNDGDDKQADNQREAISAATEHAKLVVTERAHAQAYCRS